jgi:hypothetical protein
VKLKIFLLIIILMAFACNIIIVINAISNLQESQNVNQKFIDDLYSQQIENLKKRLKEIND